MVHYRLHHDPHSSHQQIVRLVRNLHRSPVLDVGSAQGMLGQLLQGSGLLLDAVEPNPTWAEATKPYYRQTFVGMIEQVALQPKHYEVIVCADILEHTADPVAVVESLRKCAADDASFIISVPNVAHLAVRIMLLFGMFPKMERGILDKTHLQFLTRKTAIQMLDRAGLRVERVLATGVPLEELWKTDRPGVIFKFVREMQWLMVRLLPRLFGFQWIFLAKPK
jgi:2-polyprenyl-3-methyl-5-hydroxy-6-metoxy-1,4-benzoquinol methylase